MWKEIIEEINSYRSHGIILHSRIVLKNRSKWFFAGKCE